MTKISVSEAAKAVVRRNTEEVQGGGNFEVFEELFADDFLDHTPQPDVRRTRLARASFTRFCALPSRTSTRTSTGSLPMGTG